jgi:hypothetical protein
MNYQLFQSPTFSRTAFAVAIALAGSNASALTTLPEYTWNPAAVALTGTSFTADNIIVSDFATATFTPGNTFHEDGYLPVSGFQLDGKDIVAGGLNSTYRLYFHFTGDGVVDGPISVLTYELFGTNSVPAFGPGGTISGAVAPMQLAAGSLISGSTGTINGQQGAGVSVTFNASSTPFLRCALGTQLLQRRTVVLHSRRRYGHTDRQRVHDRQRRRLLALRDADSRATYLWADVGWAWGLRLRGAAAKTRLMRSSVWRLNSRVRSIS